MFLIIIVKAIAEKGKYQYKMDNKEGRLSK